MNCTRTQRFAKKICCGTRRMIFWGTRQTHMKRALRQNSPYHLVKIYYAFCFSTRINTKKATRKRVKMIQLVEVAEICCRSFLVSVPSDFVQRSSADSDSLHCLPLSFFLVNLASLFPLRFISLFLFGVLFYSQSVLCKAFSLLFFPASP